VIIARNMNSTVIATKAAPGEVPPRIGQSSQLGLWLWLLAGIAALGMATLYLFDPSRFSFYPTCTLYRTTGILCPGCGSLRAMHQLLHGHLAEALRFNALLVCSLPFAGATAGLWLARKLHGQSFSLRARPAWVWIGSVIIVLFAIARNLPFVRALGLTP
jgi:hypothetical protein